MADSKITFKDVEKVNSTLKTTSIKGKQYTEVNQRIKAFRMLYPDGFIKTDFIELDTTNGVVVTKTTVGYYDDNGNEHILGTGVAHEWRNKPGAMVNKTSFIENCVPLDTQILTKNGWKFFYQLHKGEEVLSLNMETQKVEFCELLDVVRYNDASLVKLETSRFKAVCTPQHKWVTDSQASDGILGKTETKNLKPSDRIVQNIRQEVTPSDLGRKLGWLMCDCEIVRSKNGMPGRACISQAKHIEDVKSLFGEPSRLAKKYDPKWMDCYEWDIPAEEVRNILGAFDISTYEDLSLAMLKASIEDVAGCYQSMMLADGDSRGFSSTYLPLVEAIQIMCARLGIPTSFITSRRQKNSTKPIYTLGIKKSKRTFASEIKQTNLPPKDVWCPKTANSTWFMKQGSFVTLTSNCETSAIGRALGMLGIGIDTAVASAEEVKYAVAHQEEEQPVTPQNTPKNASQSKKVEYICENCHKPVTDAEGHTVNQIVAATRKKFNDHIFCMDCAHAIKRQMEEKKAQEEADKEKLPFPLEN